MTKLDVNNKYINPDKIGIETGTTADGKKKGTTLLKFLKRKDNIGKCIKLSKNESQNISAGGSYTKITWQNEEINTSGGLLTFEDNGVKIGKGINTILINAELQTICSETNKTNASFYLKIMKKDSAGNLTEIANAQTLGTSVYNNVIAPVQEGDLIFIETYFTKAGYVSAAFTWNTFNVTILN